MEPYRRLRHREHWVAAERIRVLFTLFERRTIVAHQSLLRDRPQQLYGLLFKRIGVGPPPAGTQYHRYNSVGGERTGLCRRKKILAEFQVLWLNTLLDFPAMCCLCLLCCCIAEHGASVSDSASAVRGRA